MSGHWDPEMFADRRLRAVRAAQSGKAREPIRHGKAVFNGRELRMMIIIGLIVAVAGYFAMSNGTSVAPVRGDASAQEKANPGGSGLAAHRTPQVRPNVASAPAQAVPAAPSTRPAVPVPAEPAARREVSRLLRGVIVQPAAARPLDVSTFELRGARIRIADIDAPRLAGACPYESGLAQRAFSRVRDWMSLGPFELSEAGGPDRDREGRRLRVVSRDGESVGGVLVSEGLARPYTGQELPWCAIGVSIL